jgi:hypothetical protein
MLDETRWRPRIVAGGDASSGLSGSVLFRTLWEALGEILGSTATAVLLRRAARRAMAQSPELRGIAIERIDGAFHYALPASFVETRGPPAALRELAFELRPLLAEMTGELALRHLERVPELRHWAAAGPPS